MLLPVTCMLSAYQHVLSRYDRGIQASGLLQQLCSDSVYSRVRKIAKSHYELRHVFICLATWNNLAPTGRIFVKFDF
jgi:hypothetical protein